MFLSCCACVLHVCIQLLSWFSVHLMLLFFKCLCVVRVSSSLPCPHTPGFHYSRTSHAFFSQMHSYCNDLVILQHPLIQWLSLYTSLCSVVISSAYLVPFAFMLSCSAYVHLWFVVCGSKPRDVCQGGFVRTNIILPDNTFDLALSSWLHCGAVFVPVPLVCDPLTSQLSFLPSSSSL